MVCIAGGIAGGACWWDLLAALACGVAFCDWRLTPHNPPVVSMGARVPRRVLLNPGTRPCAPLAHNLCRGSSAPWPRWQNMLSRMSDTGHLSHWATRSGPRPRLPRPLPAISATLSLLGSASRGGSRAIDQLRLLLPAK